MHACVHLGHKCVGLGPFVYVHLSVRVAKDPDVWKSVPGIGEVYLRTLMMEVLCKGDSLFYIM